MKYKSIRSAGMALLSLSMLATATPALAKGVQHKPVQHKHVTASKNLEQASINSAKQPYTQYKMKMDLAVKLELTAAAKKNPKLATSIASIPEIRSLIGIAVDRSTPTTKMSMDIALNIGSGVENEEDFLLGNNLYAKSADGTWSLTGHINDYQALINQSGMLSRNSFFKNVKAKANGSGYEFTGFLDMSKSRTLVDTVLSSVSGGSSTASSKSALENLLDDIKGSFIIDTANVNGRQLIVHEDVHVTLRITAKELGALSGVSKANSITSVLKEMDLNENLTAQISYNKIPVQIPTGLNGGGNSGNGSGGSVTGGTYGNGSGSVTGSTYGNGSSTSSTK